MSADIQSIFNGLLPGERLLFNEPMCRHTTFKIGGPADCLAMPSGQDEVISLLRAARLHSLPVRVLGNCSNVLVKDGGLRGLTIIIGKSMSSISADGCTVTAQAGVSMGELARFLAANSLAGFEFASGIPGTLGGGVFMNAGAYNGEVGQVVKSVTVIDGSLKLTTLTHDEAGFAYRHTAIPERALAVVGAELQLAPGDSGEITAKIVDFTHRRQDRQPLEYPSAGSMFKRPDGAYAAALIDSAGLKGLTVGGAQVSPKHAGFFINIGGATAADVLELIHRVQDAVYKTSGFMLEPEVRILG